jgi:hypothetical protein
MDLPWLAQVVEVSWKKEVCTMKLPGCPAVDCRNHFSKLVPGLDVGPSAWLDSSRTRGIAETLTENQENGSNCSNHASAPSGQLRQSGYDGDVGANPDCYSAAGPSSQGVPFLTANAPTNADQPHNLSSAQLADESGALLGLSPEGIELFKQCMASKGYLAGPRLSDDGGT